MSTKMSWIWKSALAALATTHAAAQTSIPQAQLQSVAYNSSFTISEAQLESAQLPLELADTLNNYTRFERSQLANGGPEHDEFYSFSPEVLPEPLEFGIVLKVEEFTDTQNFTIPPGTSLSRILYTTTTINGTIIPASAFILWPFIPRRFTNTSNDAAPSVLWAHGTSGFFANGAPSAHRALYYGQHAPFPLALAGYAVVAPDYQGIGLSTSWDGSNIPHPYLMSPAGALDTLYAFKAAQEAFPGRLTDEFVVMGHSQGGGVAWSVAETLADNPDLGPRYLGTIAVSPVTDALSLTPVVVIPWISYAVKTIFPTFELQDWLTPLGIARADIYREIQAGTAAARLFFEIGDILNGYRSTWYTHAYAALANVGRRNFKGPMLVIHGNMDPTVLWNLTEAVVEDTCEMFDENDLEFMTVRGMGHTPVLDATQHLWLDWIQDRFSGRDVTTKGCSTTEVGSFTEGYQAFGNSFPVWADLPQDGFQQPLAI